MAGHPLQYVIEGATMAAHEARWYVWAGGERMPRTSKMRGTWGYDAECSCGWGSKTGGATERSVLDALWDHRYERQCAAKTAAALEAGDAEFIAAREAEYERLTPAARDLVGGRAEYLGMTPAEYGQWKQSGAVAGRVMRMWRLAAA